MNKLQREQRNNEIISLYRTGQYTEINLANIFKLSRRMIINITKGMKPYNGTYRWKQEGRTRIDSTTELSQTDATIWKIRHMRNPPEHLPGRHTFRKDGKEYVYYENDDFWRHGP